MKNIQPFNMSKRFDGIKLLSAAASKMPKDLIPLSFGFPAIEAYNASLMATCSLKAIEAGGYKCLEYTGATGPSKITKWIKERSKLRGINAQDENILVTTGSGQAMDLVARALTNEGDEIWVEAPTFFGALRSFALAGLTMRAFEIDEEGLKVDLVEAALKEAKELGGTIPKFIYIIPNYHNPMGVTLSLERRKKLAELAEEYNFFIVEDDAYGELTFKKEILPAVYSFAPDRVTYISTFSKTIAPAIRMGWIVMNSGMIMKLRMLKSDGATSVLMQEIIATYLDEIEYEQHIENLSTIYKSRLDVMVKALDEYFGKDITYTIPDGGFFLWVSFNQEVDTSLFEKAAIENSVSFIPGEHCYHSNGEKNHIRLCFSYCNEEQCIEGVKRIAQVYYETYPMKSVV